MDAKITKQRLGNLLAYDWLKILAAVAAAVVALALIFTMVGTRPTNEQTFSVYSYSDLSTGRDFQTLSSALEEDEVFSYDILSVVAESFDTNPYAGATFNARRAAGEGDVLLVADTPVYGEEDGKLDPESTPLLRMTGGVAYRGNETAGYYDTEYFLSQCKNYLAGFFGAGLANASPDAEAVRESFLARNERDKRFRSQAKKEEGVALETARLVKLREDYLFVENAFEEGRLSHKKYETEDGEFAFGISLARLTSVTSLVYFAEDGSASAAPVTMMIFRNSTENDLKYEAVSLLRYLVEKYGA